MTETGPKYGIVGDLDATSGFHFHKKLFNPKHEGQRSVYRALGRPDTLPPADGKHTNLSHEGRWAERGILFKSSPVILVI